MAFTRLSFTFVVVLLTLLYTLFSPFHTTFLLPLLFIPFCPPTRQVEHHNHSSEFANGHFSGARLRMPFLPPVCFRWRACGGRGDAHRHRYVAWSRAPSHSTFVKDHCNWAYLLSPMQTPFYHEIVRSIVLVWNPNFF